MMIHPARTLPFRDLADGLEASKAAGMVATKESDGRTIYVYTNRCVYDNGWNEFTLLARGLILDHADRRIVATPFPKFFNAGERNGTIPDLPFEVYEKVDGSLAILHHHRGAWRAATKGAFDSTQARWVEGQLAQQNLSPLDPGTTYLVEAVYPENRIVVHYDKAELVLLAAYHEDGSEADYDGLANVAAQMGWRMAARHSYSAFSDLLTAAAALPANEEGFVIRFPPHN
jgi:RNA ligase